MQFSMKFVIFILFSTTYFCSVASVYGYYGYYGYYDPPTECGMDYAVVNCNPVCSECDCANTAINCRSKHLESPFSTDIDDWKLSQTTTNLETIDFSHNLIKRIVMLPSLPIKTLNFSHNQIIKIYRYAFHKLANIEEIDVSHNKIDSYDFVSSTFRGEDNETYYEPLPLKSLNLANNTFSTLSSDIFEQLPLLERLSLSRNPLGPYLDHAVVIAITSVTKLQFLDLSFTILSSLPAFLQNLPDLQELILSNNYFLQLPAEGLSNLKALKILRLDETPINAFTSKNPFPEIPTLEELHISKMTRLNRIGSKSLQGLTGLKYLFCYDNRFLSKIPADALFTDNIIKMDFHDNRLESLPEGLVKNWEKIQIDLSGNSLSCDCENQWMLTKILPQINKETNDLVCASPNDLVGTSMFEIATSKREMRCLDYFITHPKTDQTFTIATFVIVLIAILSAGIYFLFKHLKCNKNCSFNYNAIRQQSV